MNRPLPGIVCTEYFSTPIGALGLAARRLISALPRRHLSSGGLHAGFPAARFRPARVRALISVPIDTRKPYRTGSHFLRPPPGLPLRCAQNARPRAIHSRSAWFEQSSSQSFIHASHQLRCTFIDPKGDTCEFASAFADDLTGTIGLRPHCLARGARRCPTAFGFVSEQRSCRVR